MQQTIDSQTSKLTPKQKKFAERYIIHGNASSAYKESYNVVKMTDAQVSVEASKLTRHPHVSEYIKKLQAKKDKIVEEKLNITIEDLITRANDVYFSAETPKEKCVAIDLLAKMIGAYEKNNHMKHDVNGGEPIIQFYVPSCPRRKK